MQFGITLKHDDINTTLSEVITNSEKTCQENITAGLYLYKPIWPGNNRFWSWEDLFHLGQDLILRVLEIFIDTCCFFLAGSTDIASIIWTIFTGKTIVAGMFFAAIILFFRHINFSGQSWYLDKGHNHVLIKVIFCLYLHIMSSVLF